MDFDFILTTDRTMMTNHHGKEFLGFMTTSPAVGLPERLWMWLCAPKMKTDKAGRVWQAPYGLRKIEAALIDAGFKAAVVDPSELKKYSKSVKAILIGHHDFFAFCAPSSTWWVITGKEPVNRKYFMKLMESPAIREAKKRGAKLIVGGPAAWQWLHMTEYWTKWGVDTVVDGEAEKVIVDLAQRIIEGRTLPKYVYVGPQEAPSIEEIPIIKHASVNGLVEIMRGCPRGCKFCSVTLRPLRYIPLDVIEKEISVNVREGVRYGLLHSEDVLIYGANGVHPRPKPLFKLHEITLKYYRAIAWSHSSLSAIVCAEREHKLVSKLTEYIFSKTGQKFLGLQTGIETGSPRLAKEIMSAKAAPYKVEEWPDIVEEAFAIMHDNMIIPAATLILNVPNETTDDIIKTAELLERLKPYRSLIVPMYFVPLGVLKDQSLQIRIKPEHVDIMWLCLEHAFRWVPVISKMYLEGPFYFPLRVLIDAFLWWVRRQAEALKPKLKAYIEKLAEESRKWEPSSAVVQEAEIGSATKP